MADKVAAEAPIVIHPSDTEPLKFPFTKAIPTGATIVLSSVVIHDPDTGAVYNPAELALASGAVNSQAFNTKHDGTGDTIPVSQAAVYTPSGQVAGNNYRVTISVTVTDADSNEWTKAGVWTVKCLNS